MAEAASPQVGAARAGPRPLVVSVGGMTPGRVKRIERYKEYG
jgi:hypothetical protein